MANKINFTTPVGRLVGGSAYTPNTTDFDGKPLIVKTGANAGQPRVNYTMSVAIPKEPGHVHWAQTDWGAKILACGREHFPAGQAEMPTFAWKITDGDSQIPGQGKGGAMGKKPCDIEGYKGCWVVRFSGGFAPKIYNADGSQLITEPDAVKLGYYIQINGTVSGNTGAKPGVYMNLDMVALSAYGPEIFVGKSVEEAGFGAAPLPAGASATPLGGFTPPPAAVPGVPGLPASPLALPTALPPGYAATPPALAAALPAAVPPALPAVGIPALPAVMPPPNAAYMAPPAPPAAPVRVMLPAANGATYEQLVGAGWTDQLLVAHGMMQA